MEPVTSVRLQRVLEHANDEAARLGHEFIGTEHLLLALTLEEEGVAYAVFEALDVSRTKVRALVERTIEKGSAPPDSDRPYTTRSTRVLALAREAATELGHSYLGTEHLLLGLTSEAHGIGGQVLAQLGVTHDRARAEVLRVL